MATPACCFAHLTSQRANLFERSQIRIGMRTDIEDVRSSDMTEMTGAQSKRRD
jgi:hypothetical protein